MKYEIFKEPFTHIVIDDWLPWVHLLQVTNSVTALVPSLKVSKVNSDQGIVVSPNSKSSKNLWLFQAYQNKQVEFNLPAFIEGKIWSEDIKNILKETQDSLFQTALYTDTSQMLLSKYADGDHYSWHRDYNPTITMNLMLAKEPLDFTGGDFVFGDWENKVVKKTIPFKNNRLVIFPSRVFHCVTPVSKKIANNLTDRFTIQYWTKLKDIREV
jgi:predicted 2-oxoglutarate/Fe(II)-dependent dioxygenase YbiX